MNERAHQIALPMAGPVSLEVIARCRDMGEAIRLSIQVACLDQKQIYIPVKLDKGHWSRVMSGELAFPSSQLEALMDLTGNDIPLQWLAHRRGLGVHPLETRTERELRESREQAAKLEDENRLLRELLTGRKA